MKRFYTLLLTAMATVGLAACDGGGDDKQPAPDLTLAPGTAQELTLYADQTATPTEGISFTTTGPWRATVSETRASEVDWITLSQDHGDAAGSYTLGITLAVNTSGADRRATITIECGATKITITVEQKGTTEQGEVPGTEEPAPGTPSKLISKIELSFSDPSSTESVTSDFTYDDQNRLTKYVEVYKYEDVVEFQEYQYEYGDGVIHVTTKYSSPDSFKDEPESYTAYLNEAGYVTRAEWEDGRTVTYTYDDANQMIRVENGDTEQEEYVWKDGNIVEQSYTWQGEEQSVNYFTYYENPSKTNFDLFYAYFSWDEELGIAGRLGVRNSQLMKQCRGKYNSKDDFDATYELDNEEYVTSYTKSYSPDTSSHIYKITYIDAK